MVFGGARLWESGNGVRRCESDGDARWWKSYVSTLLWLTVCWQWESSCGWKKTVSNVTFIAGLTLNRQKQTVTISQNSRRWRTHRYSTNFRRHTCCNNGDWLFSPEDKTVPIGLPSIGILDRLPRGGKTLLLIWKVSQWRITVSNSPSYHQCWLNGPKQHANIKYFFSRDVIRRCRPTSPWYRFFLPFLVPNIISPLPTDFFLRYKFF